jgi:hypothetical protein
MAQIDLGTWLNMIVNVAELDDENLYQFLTRITTELHNRDPEHLQRTLTKLVARYYFSEVCPDCGQTGLDCHNCQG